MNYNEYCSVIQEKLKKRDQLISQIDDIDKECQKLRIDYITETVSGNDNIIAPIGFCDRIIHYQGNTLEYLTYMLKTYCEEYSHDKLLICPLMKYVRFKAYGQLGVIINGDCNQDLYSLTWKNSADYIKLIIYNKWTEYEIVKNKDVISEIVGYIDFPRKTIKPNMEESN